MDGPAPAPGPEGGGLPFFEGKTALVVGGCCCFAGLIIAILQARRRALGQAGELADRRLAAGSQSRPTSDPPAAAQARPAVPEKRELTLPALPLPSPAHR